MKAYSRNRETDHRPCYWGGKQASQYHNLDIYDYTSTKLPETEKGWRLIKNSSISSLEKQFKDLAEKWKDETGIYSTSQQKVYNKHYLTIISLGESVLPFILKDMKDGGTWHWHTALSVIADINILPQEDMSNPKKIKAAWIKWGGNKNII